MNSNQVSILECARPLLFLNLHRLQREPNIAGWMSGRHYAAEGRMSVESTHRAAARRQWEGNGISGTVKMSRRKALFYYLLDLILFYDTGGWKQ